MKRQILLRSIDAKPFVKQHKAPCSDCPWARKSVPGWLGPNSVNTWIGAAHSDGIIACHTRLVSREVTGRYGNETANAVSRRCNGHWQCAGAAIYRANVVKSPRDPLILQLPANKVTVFSWGEFERHHGAALAKMGLDHDTSLEDA